MKPILMGGFFLHSQPTHSQQVEEGKGQDLKVKHLSSLNAHVVLGIRLGRCLSKAVGGQRHENIPNPVCQGNQTYTQAGGLPGLPPWGLV